MARLFLLTRIPFFQQALRRSIKGEKDARPQHISITPKSAVAIVPPKKVRSLWSRAELQ
jgi:bud emergence protein 1